MHHDVRTGGARGAVRRQIGRRVVPVSAAPAALVVLGVLLLPGGIARGDDALRDQHAKVARQAVQDLESLWGQARARKLLAEAEDLARRLVHFAPDHARARQWLGDRKGDDGTWTPASPHSPPQTDGDEKAAASFRATRDKKLGALAARLWALRDAAGAFADPQDLYYLLSDVAVLAPGDPRLVREDGAVARDGWWRCADAVATTDAHRGWFGERDRLTSALPPGEDVALHPDLARFEGIEWSARRRVGEVAVWGGCYADEADLVAGSCVVAAQLFRRIFRTDTPIPTGFGVVDLPARTDAKRLYDQLGFREDECERYEASGAFALPGSALVVAADWRGSTVRPDHAVHMLGSRLFLTAFGEGPQSAWAAEATGSLLTHLLFRSRYTFLGGWKKTELSPLEAFLDADLYRDRADWMGHARDLVDARKLPALADVAPLGLGDLYVLEVLAGYVHLLRLVGAHGEAAPRFFARLGRGETLEAALLAETGLTLAAWEARTPRYLHDLAPSEEAGTRGIRVSAPPPR